MLFIFATISFLLHHFLTLLLFQLVCINNNNYHIIENVYIAVTNNIKYIMEP